MEEELNLLKVFFMQSKCFGLKFSLFQRKQSNQWKLYLEDFMDSEHEGLEESINCNN